MHTPQTTPEYLLLLRGQPLLDERSPEEIQAAMSRFTNWMEGLTRQGKLKGGQPLGPEGRVVSGAERSVADGPFAEAKETIGGYLVLTVADLDEATAIAETLPWLDYGVQVEVRPLLEECPTVQRLHERMATAAV
jgi:hypothetical protein